MSIKAWLYLIISLSCLYGIYTNYISLNELVLFETTREYTTLNLTYYDYETGSKLALTNPKVQESQPYVTKLDLYNIVITTLNIVICLLSFMFCFSGYIEENKIRLRNYLGKEK
jgi:hypothetical protein